MKRAGAVRAALAGHLPPPFARGMAFAWAALALALGFTLAIWRYAASSAEREAEQHFQFESQQVRDAIRDRMADYEQVLRGAAALFAASVSVERHQWKSYVEALHLERRFPGVQGLGFARLVLLHEREAHIRAVRAEGFPDYRIHPAGERRQYTPVTYVEPFAGRNLHAFGYDMYSDPVRRAAMERARDSGEPTLSGRITLVIESEQDAQAGSLLYLPVYRNGAPQGTPDERRAALQGYVHAAFRMKNLVRGILGAHPGNLDLELYDGADASPAALMYDDAPRGQAPVRFVRALPLDVGGRAWTVRLSSTPAFEAEVANPAPRLILGVGAIVSALLFLLIAATVAAREKDLRARNILDSALDAIVIIDGDGKVVEFNPSAARVFGYSREQALGRELADLVIPPTQREAHRRGLARLRETGASQVLGRILDMSALRADGSEFPVSLTVVPVAGVEPPLFAGFMRDISKRKWAEEALRASESRLQQLLGATPAVIWASRAEGEYARKFVSENVRQVFGYAPEDFTSEPGFWASRIHPEDRPHLFARLPREIETNKFAHEYRFRHANGEWRWVRADATVVRDAEGRPEQIVGYWTDVTDRKGAELALVESQRRQAALLNSIPDIAWLKDAESRFIAVNEPFARACGRRAQELLGLSDLDIWPRELAERYRADDAEVMRSGRPKRAEEPLQGADGRRTWIETVKVPIFAENGRVAGTAGIARDITERKTLAEELERSRERLQFALEASGAALWDADPASGEVYLSERWAEIVGAPKGETRTTVRDLLALAHPEEQQKLLAAVLPVLKGERTSYREEHRVRAASGDWRWVLSVGTVSQRSADGRAARVSGINLDITARKRTEDAVRENEERFKAMFEHAPQALVMVDAGGAMLLVNGQAERTFGYRREELLGRGIEVLVPERHRAGHPGMRAGFFAAPEARAMGRGRYLFARRKDGAELPVEIGLSPLSIGGQRLALASIVDITDRHRARVVLEQALRAKSEFMNNVTHELRTPLNSVIGFAELLKDEVPGPLNAKQAQFAADIHDSGLRLLALVEGILEMSRLDVAGAALQREPVEIGAVLEERVAAQRKAAEARGLTMRLDLAADTGRAELDPQALRRILHALIDNAIKFNRAGGTVTVSARRAGGAVEIAVADTGIGIAPENLPKLFQPLVQLDAALARRYGGIGLGLALAKRLAELHGGTIEVESQPGKGSTFTLRLPTLEKS